MKKLIFILTLVLLGCSCQHEPPVVDEQFCEILEKLNSEFPKQIETKIKRSGESWLKAEFLPNVRPATVEDYEKWLKGYLLRGGKISHWYDYEFTGYDWFVAEKDLVLEPLYGANLVWLIVPESIEVQGADNFGHSGIFYMKNFSSTSPDWAPYFRGMFKKYTKACFEDKK